MHRCGYHPSVIADDDVTAHLAYDDCPWCAEVERQNRVDHEREAKDFENSPPSSPRPSDGRTAYIRLGVPPAPPEQDDETEQREGSVTDGNSP